MTNQEKIFRLLALEGDCWCVPKIAPEKEGVFSTVCIKCGAVNRFHSVRKLSEDGQSVVDDDWSVGRRIDLTTPDGVMWMLVRLSKWNRVFEFAMYILISDEELSAPENMWEWLATDAKDGKVPALYTALCEFLRLEVEG